VTTWKIRFSGGQVHRCVFKYLFIQYEGQPGFKKIFLMKNNKVIFLGCFELFSWNCNLNNFVNFDEKHTYM